MADSDPRYPRFSIEDDFNYGSCVASSSVHIRMGTWPRCSASLGHPWSALLRTRPPEADFRLQRERALGSGLGKRAPVSRVGKEGPLSFLLSGLQGRPPSFGSWRKSALPSAGTQSVLKIETGAHTSLTLSSAYVARDR